MTLTSKTFGSLFCLLILAACSASNGQERESTTPSQKAWELTDDDRMSDDELMKELFGDNADQNKPTEIDRSELDTNSVNRAVSPNARTSVQKQTIENYLSDIRSVKIDTSVPAPTNIDSVDRPQLVVPEQRWRDANFRSVKTVYFQTPDTYHKPLYFEDRNLEGYGIHRGLCQPINSAGRFAGNVLALPKSVLEHPPRSCVHRQNLRYSLPGLIK